jgi:hypothetical protein
MSDCSPETAYLTVSEAVAFFDGKVSARLLYRLAATGALRSVRLGRKVLLLASGLRALLECQEATRKPQAPEEGQRPAKAPSKPQKATQRQGKPVFIDGQWVLR